MYVAKILVEQVIKLFIEQPNYRDDNYGTIEYIVKKHYADDYGKSITVDFKLMSDISRAYRYIQQFEPKLRGENWLKRQRQGGVLSKSAYDTLLDNQISEIVQLTLFEYSHDNEINA